MDGTFSDHQSVLEDIMVSRGIPYDKKVIEEIHHNRVRCKSVPFTEIDLDIIDVIKNLKNEI
jgi:putative hydrolase of the HAD superfamily